jgi:phenylpropionate dioxygenase-like ring-hydroxylating dioxygenase large terminal subunit
MFIRNAWYVGAWSRELALKPVARTILGAPVVFFRTASGRPAALEDECCHRGLPLSLGEVDGEIIRCHYHGLEFGCDGVCSLVPGQDKVPSKARVRSYPIVESDKIVWIWPGDPALANPDEVISYPYHHQESGWAAKISDCWRLECYWEMVNDNLLDLTHLAYVHRSTIGGNAAAHVNAITEVTPIDRGIRFARRLPNSAPPPAYLAAVKFKGNIDRWQEFEATPGLVVTYSGATDANTGAYEGRREGGLHIRVFNGITPETETTTHYFWSTSLKIDVDQQKLDELIVKHFGLAEFTFREDQVVLQAQQQRVSSNPNRELVDIRSDAAGLQMRRAMKQLCAVEQERSRPVRSEIVAHSAAS